MRIKGSSSPRLILWCSMPRQDANALEHGDADGLDVARAKGIVFLAAGIQGRGDEAVEFVVEPYRACPWNPAAPTRPRPASRPMRSAERIAIAGGREPASPCASIAAKMIRILRRANHNPPLGQIHRNFLIARLLRECRRGERNHGCTQMNTDKNKRSEGKENPRLRCRVAIVTIPQKKSISFSLSVFIRVHPWFQSFFFPRDGLQRREWPRRSRHPRPSSRAKGRSPAGPAPAGSGLAPARRPASRQVCRRCCRSRGPGRSAHSRVRRPASPAPSNSPTRGTSAASAWSSPSAASSGARAFRMRSASRTFSTRAWLAEALVENDSNATRGSASRIARAFSAVARAISASSSGFGSGTTAQSAKSSAPAGPRSNPGRCGIIMTKKLETSFASGARPIACSAARTVSPVVLAAPPTVPSASPAATLSAAK